ncbi:hypothetical protein Bbelb_417440 [Branchiostoma belcheri]|nr:hypothetical protein Bbelb_417440 [Branchiostoma belcheri]
MILALARSPWIKPGIRRSRKSQGRARVPHPSPSQRARDDIAYYRSAMRCPTPAQPAPAEVWGREFATNKCLMDPDNDVHQSRKISGDPQVFATCSTEVLNLTRAYPPPLPPPNPCHLRTTYFRDCGIVVHNLNRSIFILNPTRPSAVYLDRLEAFFHVVLRGPKSGQAGTVYDASRLSSTSRAGMAYQFIKVPLKKLEITFKHVWAGPVGSGRENNPASTGIPALGTFGGKNPGRQARFQTTNYLMTSSGRLTGGPPDGPIPRHTPG